jgi:4-amino-4-deoxy-L-arabinose transferase-like glycosyltransferase
LIGLAAQLDTWEQSFPFCLSSRLSVTNLPAFTNGSGAANRVIFFAISLPFFFLVVREAFSNTATIWATFFYAFAPLNVFAGRSFMPDVPSLNLGIIGLYFFPRWLGDSKPAPFYLAAIAISLSFLIKVTTIVIAAPLLYLALKLRDEERVKARLAQRGGYS